MCVFQTYRRHPKQMAKWVPIGPTRFMFAKFLAEKRDALQETTWYRKSTPLIGKRWDLDSRKNAVWKTNF